MSYSNHIDLMPTLAEVAIGMEMPPCPTGKAIVDNVFCTMGKSLAPILRNASAVVNQAAFSQYPRGRPPHSAALAPEQVQSTPSPSLCLHKACIMGYSVITFINGNEWRYTEWVEFNGEITNSMAWNKNYGTELYDMTHGKVSAGDAVLLLFPTLLPLSPFSTFCLLSSSLYICRGARAKQQLRWSSQCDRYSGAKRLLALAPLFLGIALFLALS